jgi:DNA invertase Pin-like site-specific DNA recombinase
LRFLCAVDLERVRAESDGGSGEGDTVVVWKLDRLGRNMLHILETVKALTDRGVTLISTTDGIDSSTAAARMMIGVLGSLAEYERELTKERTDLKRAASRANGTKFGRPKKVQDRQDIVTARRMKEEGHPVKQIWARGARPA